MQFIFIFSSYQALINSTHGSVFKKRPFKCEDTNIFMLQILYVLDVRIIFLCLFVVMGVKLCIYLL